MTYADWLSSEAKAAGFGQWQSVGGGVWKRSTPSGGTEAATWGAGEPPNAAYSVGSTPEGYAIMYSIQPVPLESTAPTWQALSKYYGTVTEPNGELHAQFQVWLNTQSGQEIQVPYNQKGPDGNWFSLPPEGGQSYAPAPVINPYDEWLIGRPGGLTQEQYDKRNPVAAPVIIGGGFAPTDPNGLYAPIEDFNAGLVPNIPPNTNVQMQEHLIVIKYHNLGGLGDSIAQKLAVNQTVWTAIENLLPANHQLNAMYANTDTNTFTISMSEYGGNVLPALVVGAIVAAVIGVVALVWFAGAEYRENNILKATVKADQAAIDEAIAALENGDEAAALAALRKAPRVVVEDNAGGLGTLFGGAGIGALIVIALLARGKD